MGRIVRRPAAKLDLIEIYRFIAEGSSTNAVNFLGQIDDKLYILSDQPEMGVARLDAFPDVRIFPIGNYLIIYRPLSDERGIELIRVYHGAREWQILIEGDV